MIKVQKLIRAFWCSSSDERFNETVRIQSDIEGKERSCRVVELSGWAFGLSRELKVELDRLAAEEARARGGRWNADNKCAFLWVGEQDPRAVHLSAFFDTSFRDVHWWPETWGLHIPSNVPEGDVARPSNPAWGACAVRQALIDAGMNPDVDGCAGRRGPVAQAG